MFTCLGVLIMLIVWQEGHLPCRIAAQIVPEVFLARSMEKPS